MQWMKRRRYAFDAFYCNLSWTVKPDRFHERFVGPRMICHTFSNFEQPFHGRQRCMTEAPAASRPQRPSQHQLLMGFPWTAVGGLTTTAPTE